MPLATGTKLGPYEILSQIGAGGMGEVYCARDTKLARLVAVKVLPAALAQDPERLARFEREARLLASLDHTNIGAIYGLEESNGTRALILALIEGPTLADRIATGPIPLEEAIPIAQQMAEALEYAHDRGVIHRDLKPANVKITPEGTVKVLDFGLAKALTGESDVPSGSPSDSPTLSPTLSMRATKVGMILGTAAYMAPEQAKGKTVDRRADIWAFGVVLFEMLTGEHLFTGDTAAEIIASAIKEEPKLDRLPVSTPPVIRRLIERCLNKDPKQRLQAIGEARIILHGPVEETATGSTPTPSYSRLGWVALGVAALLALVACALAFVHFREVPADVPVVRTSIALPRNSDDVSSFALSPDGGRLAVILSVGGKFKLNVRDLDSQQFEPLSGIEEASSPFWSPDSRSIGFFADGKLKITSANGGPVETLCSASVGRGGSWNRDGLILFGSDAGPIQKTEASGGPCVPVTKPEEGSYHSWPVFLGDGKHFLYTARSGDPTKNGVYLASLDGSEVRRLTHEVTTVEFAPGSQGRPDHVLFRRGAALMAQQFDSRTFTLVGEAYRVAEPTSGGIANHLGASVAGNGVLIYLSGGANNQQYQSVWLDRSGKQISRVGQPESIRGAIALSPDAMSVATVENQGIWLRDLVHDSKRRLTPPLLLATTPVWSPTSRQIAFGAGDGLFVMDTSGGRQETPILRGANRQTLSDWSRDGQYLLYTEVDPKTRADIWALPNPATPGEHKPIPFLRTAFSESRGQFSPDGRWVAYVSDKSGDWEIYVRAFPSGDEERKVSVAGGTEPRWRADGKEIYYLKGKPSRFSLMAAAVHAGAGTFEIGAPTVLFEMITTPSVPLNNNYVYSPSSDGQRFLARVYAAEVAPTLTLVTNWQAGLKK